MPKKFAGTNTKAEAARARKQAAKQERDEELKQKQDDEFWRDDDKHINKKLTRKEEKDQRMHEKMQRKKENRDLYEQEQASLPEKAKASDAKLSRAEIQARLEEERAARSGPEPELVDNVNRLVVDEGARTVDEAIVHLSGQPEPAEKHPEKRMKASFKAFQESRLPALKQDNPTLRMSQLRQILKKEWQKSPDNPMNQRTMAYNVKKGEGIATGDEVGMVRNENNDE